jgi:hypothetical protein
MDDLFIDESGEQKSPTIIAPGLLFFMSSNVYFMKLGISKFGAYLETFFIPND